MNRFKQTRTTDALASIVWEYYHVTLHRSYHVIDEKKWRSISNRTELTIQKGSICGRGENKYKVCDLDNDDGAKKMGE